MKRMKRQRIAIDDESIKQLVDALAKGPEVIPRIAPRLTAAVSVNLLNATEDLRESTDVLLKVTVILLVVTIVLLIVTLLRV